MCEPADEDEWRLRDGWKLWSLLEPERLGPRTRAAIDDPDHERWLSPISVWETLMLAGRGRLALKPDPEWWARVRLARLPLREDPLTAEVALASRRLRVGSTDPADRFLAANARVYDLTLVTADARLRETDGVDVLPPNTSPGGCHLLLAINGRKSDIVHSSGSSPWIAANASRSPSGDQDTCQ